MISSMEDSGAGLFTRTLMNLMSTDPGFRADHLITFPLNPSLSGIPRPPALALFRELDDRFRALAQVKSVARAIFPPFGGFGWGTGVKTPGSRSASDNYIDCRQNAVSASYSQIIGIPLLAGREFSSRDTETAWARTTLTWRLSASYEIPSTAISERGRHGSCTCLTNRPSRNWRSSPHFSSGHRRMNSCTEWIVPGKD
jgi:hypothetical protein